MTAEPILVRIALLHLSLVLVLSQALGARGPSVALGGAAIGFAFLAFWGIAWGIRAGVNRVWLLLLGVAKFLAYVGLAVTGIADLWRIDGVGFATGVTCFVLATVLATLARAALPGRTV